MDTCVARLFDWQEVSASCLLLLVVFVPSHLHPDTHASAKVAGAPTQAAQHTRTHTHTHAHTHTQVKNWMVRLLKLRHPNIVGILGAVMEGGEIPLLVMECVGGGTLRDLIYNETMILDLEELLPILQSMMRGLQFLHADPGSRESIVHGNLTPANVLVDARLHVKLSDFVSHACAQKLHKCGTAFWMAPELLFTATAPTTASDMFAMGVTFWECFSRTEPYSGEDGYVVLKEVAQLERPIERRPKIPEGWETGWMSELTALITQLWHKLPSHRISAQEALRKLEKMSDSDLVGLDGHAPRHVHKARRKTKTEEVLCDLFPQHVAKDIVAGRKVEPEHHSCVTVFFSDIVGFTTIAQQMAPERVCDMLDRLYTKLDKLSSEMEVFKVCQVIKRLL